MASSIRQLRSRATQPDVRLNGSRGLILFDDTAEHGCSTQAWAPCCEDILIRPNPERECANGSMRRTITRRPSVLQRCANIVDLDPDYVRRGLIRWMNDVDNGVHVSGADIRCQQPAIHPSGSSSLPCHTCPLDPWQQLVS